MGEKVEVVMILLLGMASVGGIFFALAMLDAREMGCEEELPKGKKDERY